MSKISDCEHCSVIIVGAGIAGLAAANTLILNDVSFIIVEAQDYVGGRVKSVVTSDGIVVDLGAQFIHGETDNKIYELCTKLDCLIDAENENDEFFLTSECKSVDFEVAKQVWNIRKKVLDKTKEITMGKILFGDFLRENYEKEILNISVDASVRQAFVEWLMRYEIEDNGCLTLDDMSLSEFCSFKELEGDYMRCLKHSFQPLLDDLSSVIPKNQLRLNSEVVKVEYLVNNHSVVIELIDRLSGITKKLSCDHILWTTSIGYLKDNFLTIFATENKLIEEKQSSINHFGFGTVNKVVLIYPTTVKCWPNNSSCIYLLQLLHVPIKLSEDQLSFLLTEHVDPYKAQSVIDAIVYVRASADFRVFSFNIGGKAALFVEEMAETVLCRLCHDVLSHYLKIPNAEQNRPLHALRSEWGKNRFTRGSYSFLSVRSAQEDQMRISKPYAPDGIARVIFAGEATHPQFFSTVHGAYESGFDAARSLIGIYKK